jgi:hypothetical protein
MPTRTASMRTVVAEQHPAEVVALFSGRSFA